MKARHVWIVVGIALLAAVLIWAALAIKEARDTGRRAAENYWRQEAARELEASAAKDPSGGPETWLPDAGKLPEATLRAYYYYKDRGLYSKARDVVTQGSFEMVPAEDGQGMSARAQEARGMVVEHAEVNTDEATLYYRTWFSNIARFNGGRPTIGRLVKEEGLWKVDIPMTVQLTMTNTKGKNNLSIYDGTKEWWK